MENVNARRAGKAWYKLARWLELHPRISLRDLYTCQGKACGKVEGNRALLVCECSRFGPVAGRLANRRTAKVHRGRCPSRVPAVLGHQQWPGALRCRFAQS